MSEQIIKYGKRLENPCPTCSGVGCDSESQTVCPACYGSGSLKDFIENVKNPPEWDYQELLRLITTIRNETQPIENHHDPKAIHDVWIEIKEMAGVMEFHREQQWKQNRNDIEEITIDPSDVMMNLEEILISLSERYPHMNIKLTLEAPAKE